MGYQSILRTMKVGFMDSNYPLPAGIPEEDRQEWMHRHAAETGCDCLQVRYPFESHDAGTLARFQGLRDRYGMEYDIHVMLPVFAVNGPDGAHIAAELRRRCRIVRELDMDMLRTGYGGLRIESSRFLRPREAAEAQKRDYVAALKTCARILEDEGIYLAVENHIDFTGREQASMFEEVDSPFVGCAMDTANGIPVFSDTDDDIDALAPYTFTTHIKDYRIVQEVIPGRIPFMATSCAPGDGIVDIPRAVHRFARFSPFRRGLHLIVESSTSAPELGDIPAERRNELARERIDRGTAFLRRLREGTAEPEV
ncbi:MAG: sugar phosphate isomerase/epimerase [Clostridia bacterium]|nr:sugar phosphate isomerase/epimerase [Clostridia bacterium]